MHSDMTNWQRLLASPACDVDGPHIYPWLQRLRRGASPSLKVLTASDCTYGSTSMDCDQKHPTCTRPIRGVPQGTQVVAWPGIQDSAIGDWILPLRTAAPRGSAKWDCGIQGFCHYGLPGFQGFCHCRLRGQGRIAPIKDCAVEGLCHPPAAGVPTRF